MTKRERDLRTRLFAWLETPGLGDRQVRVLIVALVCVTALLAAGWGAVIVMAAREGSRLDVGRTLTASPLAPDARPTAAFVLDLLVRAASQEAEWRGRSGAVRVLVPAPGDTLRLADTLGLQLPAGATLEVEPVDSPGVRTPGDRVADLPGAWNVLLRVRDQVRRITDVAVLTPVSAQLVVDGRLGDYLVGEWPGREARSSRHRTAAYDQPRGLVAVTPSNIDLPISDHLVLGDFLTKGQEDVWPKFVVLSPRLLDKFELTLQELERMGHPVENVGVISAFRTPYYNAHGGATGGRGALSRHMYGDAIDFYIDNDRDGQMDDLNGDGRVDLADLRIVAEAASRVEQRYPEYVGGIGVYAPRPGAHAGFVHVDTRGYRARW